MSTAPAAETQALARYYRWHARIYDLTRWSFLFGRDRLIEEIVAQVGPAPRRILEIGCGTGRNLQALAERFPKAELHGVDLSADMLDQAGKRLAHCSDRLKLHHSAYAGLPGQYDLIVASYLLSMVGPGLDQLLADASDNLSARGRIAVVDFRDTPKPWFRRWMGLNHVHLDDRLLPRLKSRFRVQDSGTRCAYGGLWRWFWFVGGR
ncbi:MAG: methyltransferase [Rhodanobacteraceae bacterium]|nr:methyltransferase [Rhodanobacteraceae bacterium]